MFTQPRPKRTYASKKNIRTSVVLPRNVLFGASASTFKSLSIDNIRKAKQEQSYIASSSKYSPPRLKKNTGPTQSCRKIRNTPSLETTPEYKSSNMTPDVSIHLKRNSLDAFDKLLMESPANVPAIIAINTSDLDPSLIDKINISSDCSSLTTHSEKLNLDTSSDSEGVLSPRKVQKRRFSKKRCIKPVFRNLTNKNDSESVYNHSLELQKSKNFIKSNSAQLDSLIHDPHFKDILQGSICGDTPRSPKGSSLLVCDKTQESGHSACRNKNCPSNNLSRRKPNIIPFSSTPLKQMTRKLKVIENLSPISITDSPLPAKTESSGSIHLLLNGDMEVVKAISNEDTCKFYNKSYSDVKFKSNCNSKIHVSVNENSLQIPPLDSENEDMLVRAARQEDNIEKLAEEVHISSSTCFQSQYEIPTNLKDRDKTFDEPYLIGITSQTAVLSTDSRNDTASPDMFDSAHSIFENMSQEHISSVGNLLVDDLNQDSSRNDHKKLVSDTSSSIADISLNHSKVNNPSENVSKLNVTKDIQADQSTTRRSNSQEEHIFVSSSDKEYDRDDSVSSSDKSSSIDNLKPSEIHFSEDNYNRSLRSECNVLSPVSVLKENLELTSTLTNSFNHQFYDSLEDINENQHETFESYKKQNASSEDSTLSIGRLSFNINSKSIFVTRRKNTKSDECKSYAQLDLSDYTTFISFNSSKDNDTCVLKEDIVDDDGHNIPHDIKNKIDVEQFDVSESSKPSIVNHAYSGTESDEDDYEDINPKVKRRSSICLRTRRVVCNMFRKHNVKSAKKKKPFKAIEMNVHSKESKNISQTNSDNDCLADHVFAVPTILPVKEVKNFADETLQNNTIIGQNFISDESHMERPSFVLQPGKRWERSLSILKRMSMLNNSATPLNDIQIHTSPSKGRMSKDGINSVLKLQNRKDTRLDTVFESLIKTQQAPSRRLTIRIVQEDKQSGCGLELLDHKDLTTLIPESNLTGFLSDTCNDTLINLSRLSLSASDCNNPHFARRKFLDETIRVRPTARDVVLRRCNQDFPLPFDECFPDEALKHCRKIGEGVYGEVFMYRPLDDRSGACLAPRVMKVIPVEGNLLVNGEHQKKFDEILSEIVIAMELSALRSPKCTNFDKTVVDSEDTKLTEAFGGNNCTEVFSRVCAVRCVSGAYPQRLLDLWELYDETKGSENDNPSCFSADQLYIVLELENGGDDLEAFVFNNAEQACSVFDQVAIALAIAERAYQFEHRDLHWGNILVRPTDNKFGEYTLDGASYSIPLCGVQTTIIDYTLSRLTLPAIGSSSIQTTLFNDLSADDELFDAVGDYQYEIYRLMKKKNNNFWKVFEPYTNVLWLHYTLDKMITALRYKRTNSNIHKHSIGKLTELKDQILQFSSARQFVSVCYEKFIK